MYMTDADWINSKYFSSSEFHCKDSNGNDVSVANIMDKNFILNFMNPLREACGFPIVPTSTYRTPDHNKEVHGASDSAHMDTPCMAFDVMPKDDNQRFLLIKHAILLGCIRIGKYADGSLHFDLSINRPQNVIWSIV